MTVWHRRQRSSVVESPLGGRTRAVLTIPILQRFSWQRFSDLVAYPASDP